MIKRYKEGFLLEPGDVFTTESTLVAAATLVAPQVAVAALTCV